MRASWLVYRCKFTNLIKVDADVDVNEVSLSNI